MYGYTHFKGTVDNLLAMSFCSRGTKISQIFSSLCLFVQKELQQNMARYDLL